MNLVLNIGTFLHVVIESYGFHCSSNYDTNSLVLLVICYSENTHYSIDSRAFNVVLMNEQQTTALKLFQIKMVDRRKLICCVELV